MLRIIRAGIEATIQDYPGRIGYWHLGIPPSGPMDDFAARMANLLVGNSSNAACVEVAGGLFSVEFMADTVICITGSNMNPTLNGNAIPMWEVIRVKSGDVLALGTVADRGFRTYVAVAGGIDVPLYLGSRSTFAPGRIGGYQGRVLQPGDEIKCFFPPFSLEKVVGRRLEDNLIPAYTGIYELDAVEGPQASPDFFTVEDMEYFFSAEWKVDRNANRLGYRLNTHKWQWARSDGGVAGTHPSNILDNGYAVGAVNVCGDQPIILTRDGPSLGGFVCCAVVTSYSLWKIGQAIPGKALVRFRKVSYEEAVKKRRDYEAIFMKYRLDVC